MQGLEQALLDLQLLTERLRRDCPWDREQTTRTIVPHTVEEAYELADAAHSGDDAKLVDELGDVLFQVYFLALLLEERGESNLAEVADHVREKLIRRHPHVFGEAVARDAAEAIRSWGAAKRDLERGGAVFGEIPETLPGPLYALKMQKRLDNAGLRERSADEALGDVERLAGELREERSREERFRAVGELLFAAVDAARALEVDPELALRDAAERFRQDHES